MDNQTPATVVFFWILRNKKMLRFQELILQLGTKMELSKSDKTFMETIMSLIDIDSVVAEIKSRKTSDSNFFTDDEVRFAFSQWLKHHLESIESDASYFIGENRKHFDKHLDFDRIQEQSCPWGEIESNYDQDLEMEFRSLATNPEHFLVLEDESDSTFEGVSVSF